MKKTNVHKLPPQEEMFQELIKSIKEAGKILRGEIEASRTFIIKDGGVYEKN